MYFCPSGNHASRKKKHVNMLQYKVKRRQKETQSNLEAWNWDALTQPGGSQAASRGRECFHRIFSEILDRIKLVTLNRKPGLFLSHNYRSRYSRVCTVAPQGDPGIFHKNPESCNMALPSSVRRSLLEGDRLFLSWTALGSPFPPSCHLGYEFANGV